jgi:hypothetical protein
LERLVMTVDQKQQLCTTGRCAYGVDCTCDYYASWPTEKPQRTKGPARHPGRFFLDGHSAGRVDTCRRLWAHLDAEGRRLAKVIVNEDAIAWEVAA